MKAGAVKRMKLQTIRKIKICRFVIVCLLIVATTLPVSRPFAQPVPAENIAVLFVLDDSGSMGTYDPNNLRYTATKMMISALDEGDKVGFIRFSSGSEIITEKMVELTSNEAKRELLNLFQPVAPNGYTDFKAAFEDASVLLSSENLESYKTVMVFLTDGRPEIPNFYYNYPNEAVSAAVGLGIPVYAIGLTSRGQTAVLQRIAIETKGNLIPANTANDLVDSFLQILGELKDRTITSGIAAINEKSVDFYLDPALTPYVSKISFVASHTSNMRMSLTDPAGTVISEGTNAVNFMMTEDPNFSVFTITEPASGMWKFQYEGSGEIEARAILRSRLRTQILSPISAVQAGKPALISASIIEELQDGSTRKVVGNAEFSAEITLPDGTRQSLDRFYDDGTHGDVLANDGNYSREFVDTQQSGTYTVSLSGVKDVIPVSAFRNFTSVFVPPLKIIEPTADRLEIRSDPIPIRIAFDSDIDFTQIMDGKLQLEVLQPDGKSIKSDLSWNENEFSGVFMPTQDGLHTIRVITDELFIQGVRVDQSLTKTLSIKLIPSLIIEDAYLGFDVPLTLNRFDLQEVEAGIPFTIIVKTTSAQEENISISALQLPGFEVKGDQLYTIKPNESNEISVKIIPSAVLTPGNWTGFLLLSPESTVDITDNKIPVSFELYQKAIRFTLEDVLVQCDKILCFRIQPIQLQISYDSNSAKEETTHFDVNGLTNFTLTNPKQYIQPGTNDLVLELKPAGLLKAGTYAGTITFTTENPNLALENQNGGGDLRFDFQVPGLGQRCKFHAIFLVVLIIILFIILKNAAPGVIEKTKKPIVRGTLVLWKQDDPDNQSVVNLNDKMKDEISVGSSADCDIILNDPSVAAEHFKLTVTKQDGRQIIILNPSGDINSGYRRISSPTPLDESQVYSCGVYSFKFINDPNI